MSTSILQAFSHHDGVHHLQVRQWCTAAADEKGPELALVDAVLSHDLATCKVPGDLVEYATSSKQERNADEVAILETTFAKCGRHDAWLATTMLHTAVQSTVAHSATLQ